VTPQEQIEQLKAQLADRDESWFALLESIAQIIWATDANGNGLSAPLLEKAAHLSWHAFTGQIPKGESSQGWQDAIHPDDRNVVLATWQECMRTGQHYRCEYRLRHHSGEWRWMLVRGSPVRDQHGVITGWTGTATDITRRHQSEEALRESQQRLIAALEVGGMQIVVMRLSDQTLWWDEVAKRIWELDANALMDHSLDGVLARRVHVDDHEKIRNAFKEIERTKQPVAVEYRMKTADSTLRWIAARGQLGFDSDGNPQQIISAHIDITKLKIAEESIRQAQTLQALGTLAGGVAHDFNNLLLAIAGNARLAFGCNLDSEARSATAEIIKASDRATDLVRRILTFSAQQPREQASASLSLAASDALHLANASLPSNIELVQRLDEASIMVRLSTSEIQQIVLNLVANAIDAIGARPGTIEITAEVASTARAYTDTGTAVGAMLRISDNGRGMDTATRARIFEPFFTTKPVGKGTGLGLAVVHGIVQRCGGTIEIGSSPDVGTEVTVWLPLATPAALAPVERAAHKPIGHGERILYVDDDDAIVLLITRVLQHSGYRVTGHTDAHKALKELTDNPHAFDVVVTDLSMPEMNGFDLASQIKRIRPSLPVVMTSGYVRTQDHDRAQALGIERIILKPNTIEELGQVLDKICREMQS
jgi:PAS domain S-box-containing protein